MERWDIYDIDRIKTGETMERSKVTDDGAYHLAIHICLFNAKGEMLIQQRQSFKEDWPGMWDISVGGCAISGETSREAAQRELAEELGIGIDFTCVRPRFTVDFFGGFDDYYVLDADVDIDTLSLQYEEVQDARWAGKEEITGMIQSGTFIPYYNSLIHLLFDMSRQKRYGSHQR